MVAIDIVHNIMYYDILCAIDRYSNIVHGVESKPYDLFFFDDGKTCVVEYLWRVKNHDSICNGTSASVRHGVSIVFSNESSMTGRVYEPLRIRLYYGPLRVSRNFTDRLSFAPFRIGTKNIHNKAEFVNLLHFQQAFKGISQTIFQVQT